MEFSNIIRVKTSQYLIKITKLQRKAAGSKVLTTKHTASLQLLYTASRRLDIYTKFKIPEHLSKKGDKANHITDYIIYLLKEIYITYLTSKSATQASWLL